MHNMLLGLQRKKKLISFQNCIFLSNHLFKYAANPASFCLFLSFSQYNDKLVQVCLGFEPWTAEWKPLTNTLSYGGPHSCSDPNQCVLCIMICIPTFDSPILQLTIIIIERKQLSLKTAAIRFTQKVCIFPKLPISF